MRNALLSLFCFASILSFGQGVSLDSKYDKIESETYTYRTLEDQELEFDFYKAKKAKGKLPLVVFVHGGGFVSGKRNDWQATNFAKKLSERGYAVALVSYRLTMKDIGFGCEVTVEEKKGAINNASLDVTNAIAKILKENKFKIDPEKVILVGSSAGAETVLNIAYMFDYQSIIPDFKFAGVISMAGAMLDVNAITQENAIPTQLFHGTGDPLVPYHMAPHHYCGSKKPGYMMLYGAAPIAERLKGLGTAYYNYVVLGAGHDWSYLPFKDCFTEMNDFLYNDVMNIEKVRQTERIIRP